ncbi:MAG: helix-turn-helix transcriptional regulator [Patescibacteria group bacterium]|nr:helix-turn-helix transcriptional regulator [Patescibacteria group bacterium]
MQILGRLRQVREAAFMSQYDLAKVSGVARPTITRLELKQQGARMGTIRKLAAALGVKPADLLED